MSRYRVSFTVEASSAAEAICLAVIDANGEYNDRFIDMHVEPVKLPVKYAEGGYTPLAGSGTTSWNTGQKP